MVTDIHLQVLLFSYIISFCLFLFQLCYACPSSHQNILSCSCDNSTIMCSGIKPQNVSLVSDILSTIYNAPNRTVEYVDISVSGLSMFPDFAFRSCSIQRLTINFAGYSNLSADLFSKMQNSLSHLALRSNKFSYIPSIAIAKLDKIEALDLSKNLIEKITENDFQDTIHLKYLALSHNLISSIMENSFCNMSSLLELVLEYNSLSSLSSEALHGLTNLKNLYLTGNKLQILNDNLLINTPLIEYLSADENNFSVLKNVNITSSSLRILSLKNCSLNDTLASNMFCNLPNLTSLDLSLNNINIISSQAFCDYNNLQNLDLSSNTIKYLPKYSFSKLTKLAYLYLQQNAISSVDETAFFNLTKLKLLDLDYNKIESLLCQHTSSLFALEIINITFNKLKSISTGTLKYSRNLSEIALTGNQFMCDCHIQDFINLIQNKTKMHDFEVESSVCENPANLKGTDLLDVDFSSMTCKIEETCKIPDSLLPKTNLSGSTNASQTTLLLKSEFKVNEYGDSELCLNWTVNNLHKNETYKCHVFYSESLVNVSNVKIPLECSHLENDKEKFNCFTILSLKIGWLYDACLSVESTKTHILMKNCSNSVTATKIKSTTVNKFAKMINTKIFDYQSTVSANTTTENSTDLTDLNMFNITTYAALNTTAKTDLYTSTSPTTSRYENSYVPLTKFSVRDFEVYQQESQKMFILWHVSEIQTHDTCTLKLTVHQTQKNIINRIFNCTDGKLTSDFNENQKYKICLTSYHTVFGNVSNCRDFIYFQPFSAYQSRENKGSQTNEFPTSILIGLLIGVAFVIFIIVVKCVINNEKSSERYSVSKQQIKRVRSKTRPYSINAVEESETMIS